SIQCLCAASRSSSPPASACASASRPVNTHRAVTKLKDGLLEVVFPCVPDLREKELAITVRSEEE
ncbi:MAG TPA: hypothetical protein VK416_01660, partial [Thermoanaerobaculia bacterium]|nr:hypothetical protein [Thermoanaerobaculia bacterium]